MLSGPTAARNAEEGGDDVKSARPLRPGRHTHYNGRDNGLPSREAEPIPAKPALSSDGRLQLACLKLELLVTVGQHTTVNTFPGLVHTARHTMEAGNARSHYSNFSERRMPKAVLVTGVKS